MGLDPGGVTGVATWNGREGVEGIETHELPPGHHRRLFTWLDRMAPNVLVVENFTWTNTPAALVSVEYIGICKLYKEYHSDVKLVIQGREYKQFWDDGKIKNLGLWTPGSPHAMDALRHLLYYITVGMSNYTFLNYLRS